MAKDMLDAIYIAEKDCRQREAIARTVSADRDELTMASEKANLECDILSRTADKNRKRVIDGAIQRLSL